MGGLGGLGQEDGEGVAVALELQVLADQLVDQEHLARRLGLPLVLRRQGQGGFAAAQRGGAAGNGQGKVQKGSRTVWLSIAENTSARIRALISSSTPRFASVTFSAAAGRAQSSNESGAPQR